jgi:hypothetical protein
MENRHVMMPLQLGGYFYIYPDLMLFSGFRGNNARLLELSNSNQTMENLLAMILDIPDNFQQSRKVITDAETEERKEAKKEFMAQVLAKDLTGDMDARIDKEDFTDTYILYPALGNFIVFNLRFNRSYQAKSSYKDFSERVMPEFKKFANENNIRANNNEDLETAVLDEIGLMTGITDHSSTFLAFASMIAKMRKPNFTTLFKSVTLDQLTAARWGYENRMFNNILNKKFQEFYGLTKSYFTFNQLKNVLLDKAQDIDRSMIKRQLEIIKLMKSQMFRHTEVLRMNLRFNIVDRVFPLPIEDFLDLKTRMKSKTDWYEYYKSISTINDSYEDALVEYLPIQTIKTNISYTTKEVVLAIVILRERIKHGSFMPINKSLAFKLFPYIVTSSKFQGCLDFIYGLVLQLSIVTAEDLVKYSRSIVAMVIDPDFKAIMKQNKNNSQGNIGVGGNPVSIFTHSETFFSYRRRLKILAGTESSVKFLNSRSLIQDINAEFSQSNIIIAILWMIYFRMVGIRIILDDYELRYKNELVSRDWTSEITIAKMLRFTMINDRRRWASSVFARLLMKKEIDKTLFYVFSKWEDQQENTKIFYFQFSNWPKIMITWSKNTELYKVKLNRAKYPEGFDSIWEYTKSISEFLTLIFKARHRPFKDYPQLAEADKMKFYDESGTKQKKYISNLTVFDGKVIFRVDRMGPVEHPSKNFLIDKDALKEFRKSIKSIKEMESIGVLYEKINNKELEEGPRSMRSLNFTTPWFYDPIGSGLELVNIRRNETLLSDKTIRKLNVDLPTIISTSPSFEEYVEAEEDEINFFNQIISMSSISINTMFIDDNEPNLKTTKLIRRLEHSLMILFIDLIYIEQSAEDLELTELILPLYATLLEISNGRRRNLEHVISQRLEKGTRNWKIMLELALDMSSYIIGILQNESTKTSTNIANTSELRLAIAGSIIRLLLRKKKKYYLEEISKNNKDSENITLVMNNPGKVDIVESRISRKVNEIFVDTGLEVNFQKDIENSTVTYKFVTKRGKTTNELNFIITPIRELHMTEKPTYYRTPILSDPNVDVNRMEEEINAINDVLNNCEEISMHFYKNELKISLDELVETLIMVDKNSRSSIIGLIYMSQDIVKRSYPGINNVDSNILITIIRGMLIKQETAEYLTLAADTFYIGDKKNKSEIIFDRLLVAYMRDNIWENQDIIEIIDRFPML